MSVVTRLSREDEKLSTELCAELILSDGWADKKDDLDRAQTKLEASCDAAVAQLRLKKGLEK